jgi:hypothetical protein
MMAWEMVLEAASQWSSTAAGRNDGGDLVSFGWKRVALSLFDFTPRPTARDTEISRPRVQLSTVTTTRLASRNLWCAPHAHRHRGDKPLSDCCMSVNTVKHIRY